MRALRWPQLEMEAVLAGKVARRQGFDILRHKVAPLRMRRKSFAC